MVLYTFLPKPKELIMNSQNTSKISKRKFLTAAVATTASTIAISTSAKAQTTSIDAMSGLKTGKMKPMRYTELPGFLSAVH